MVEDFIKRHRKLTVIIFFIIVFGVGFVVYTYFTKSNTNTTTPTSIADSNDVVLPYANMLYTINYSADSPNKINIGAFSGYRNAAINKMYEIGINPTDYKITFTYESPFKRYE